jgi:hypothetical protein
MTRSAHRSSAVQVEKSPPPAPSDAPASSPSGVPWYWRLALFLWATSFAFLMLYELLAGIIKAW